MRGERERRQKRERTHRSAHTQGGQADHMQIQMHAPYMHMHMHTHVLTPPSTPACALSTLASGTAPAVVHLPALPALAHRPRALPALIAQPPLCLRHLPPILRVLDPLLCSRRDDCPPVRPGKLSRQPPQPGLLQLRRRREVVQHPQPPPAPSRRLQHLVHPLPRLLVPQSPPAADVALQFVCPTSVLATCASTASVLATMPCAHA
jgi:hypothetical protein